jgi:hypothetical protein
MNIEKVDKETRFVEWKKKCSALQPGEELDITDNDRTIEYNLLSWVYRQKARGFFFRKETRESRIFIIREK